MKRIKTQLLQIPFALACIVVLGGVVVTCNSLEVYINEMYDGGGKAVLVSIVQNIFMGVASLGNQFEAEVDFMTNFGAGPHSNYPS
jgi:hypothetical protein